MRITNQPPLPNVDRAPASRTASDKAPPLAHAAFVKQRNEQMSVAANNFRVMLSQREEAPSPDPQMASQQAMVTLRRELDAVQKGLAEERPALAEADWDIVLKDGQLEVIGDMDGRDRLWLEEKLSANANVMLAAHDFYDAVERFFQARPDHLSAPTSTNDYAAPVFTNVREHIDGKLPLRHILGENTEVSAGGRIETKEPMAFVRDKLLTAPALSTELKAYYTVAANQARATRP